MTITGSLIRLCSKGRSEIVTRNLLYSSQYLEGVDTEDSVGNMHT